MAPERPILKSILKKPKNGSVRRTAPRAYQSGRAGVRSTNDSEPARREKQLLKILAEARNLKERTGNVVKDLENFECSSSPSRAVRIETAHKVLIDAREAHLKCFHEQKVLIERLRVKLDAFSAFGAIFNSLLQDVDDKRTELHKELEGVDGTNVRQKDGNDRNLPASSILVRASGDTTDVGEDASGVIHDGTTSFGGRLVVSPDDVSSRFEAVDAAAASMRACSEESEKVFFAKMESMKVQQEYLKETLRRIHLDAEQARHSQMKEVQESIHEYLVKNNELLSAKAHLEALKAQAQVIDRNVEDFGLPRTENCDTECCSASLLHHLEVLKNVAISDRHLAQLLTELNEVHGELTRNVTPTTMRNIQHQEIQTLVTGARFAEAIEVHAADLSKKERSKKCENTKVKSGKRGAKSGGKENQ